MAKSIIEQLMATMSPEEQAIVKAKIVANPKIAADDAFTTNLFGLYQGAEGTTVEEPVTPPTVAPVIHTPTVPGSASAAAATAATTASTNDNRQVLELLGNLNATLETRFKALDDKFVTVANLPTLEGQVLSKSIKNAYLASRIERKHHEEFNEDLNLDDVATYIEAQRKLGVGFADIEKAHDAMVAEKRVEAKITKGIAEGVKQKTSASTVPGVSSGSSLSPAQQVIAKAKAGENNGTKTSAMIAAERLSKLSDARESGSVQ